MKIFVSWFKFHWVYSWCSIDNKSSLVQVMAWCRTGNMSSPQPMIDTFVWPLTGKRKLLFFSDPSVYFYWQVFNTLRPRQDGCQFPEDILKCISLIENIWISIEISQKFVPKGPINNIPALVQIMACRRPGNKPLSEPMIISLLTHICVTRPQWVKNKCIWGLFLFWHKSGLFLSIEGFAIHGYVASIGTDGC